MIHRVVRMKKILLLVIVLSCVYSGYAEPIPADDILAYVRSKLPDDPIKLTGSLKVKARNGFTQARLMGSIVKAPNNEASMATPVKIPK